MRPNLPEETPRAGAVAPPLASKFADFRVRLLSGVVLGGVALAAIFAQSIIPFAVIVTFVAMLMSWEWGRIVRSPALDVPHVIHLTATALAGILAALQASALGLAAVAIGTMLVFALMFGNRATMSALGVLYTGLPTIALIWIREDAPYGLIAVIFLILVVVATDTFAFVAGRLIGGPKLIPALSPNKTWSGLIGGVTAAAVVAAIFGWIVEIPMPALAICAALLGLIAQAGDIAESSLKRAYGVKDSSNLIPGHGGFMDRMDGLVAAATAAGIAALFANPAEPARQILFWLG